MIKHIKFTKDEAKDIVFVSDLHRNQQKSFLIDGRQNFTTAPPFSTPDGHDNWIEDNWHDYLKDKIVFNLGDVCFRDPKGEQFERVSKWPCKKHYVLWGNHLSGSKQCYQKSLNEFCGMYDIVRTGSDHTIGYKDMEIYPLVFNNVTFVGHDLKIYVGKQEIHLSHFPKRIWDNMSDKRKLNHEGHLSGPKPSWALSGHSHASDLTRNISCVEGKCLDVGVENAITYDNKFWFTYDEVGRIIKTKNVQVLDHHSGEENPS